MTVYKGQIASIHIGQPDVLEKASADTLTFELDGIVGDRHRGFEREAWSSGDRQPGGTIRRNERHWSAMSVEDIAQISADMDLTQTLDASDLGVNFSISGVPEFSRLTKGTILKFASGAELVVVEYNPPCSDMGEDLAQKYTKRSGQAPSAKDFLLAATVSRGVVGIVDVPGTISVGDAVEVHLYQTPKRLQRSA